ncbi:catalase [Pseudocnuella soli]|uniref:catalase n=1 Tax=Pseudocnuella soli TaxID=2502779 RepID=UPI00104A9C4C|nr:catalase [Pseudocnuella soli]
MGNHEQGNDSTQQHLTTNQGLKIADNDNSLKAGVRGATLIEDFHFREKMTHFDHERIPERVVHARGAAAHGVFRVYNDSFKQYTKAKFLTDPSLETEVFVRFSTVAGSRGSADTVRDARGFATKFYTTEGNYDLVGNNIPVFFIQDAIKFPDLVHAVKPEPHNEIPQASAAHDNFWDFISLMPESLHMIFWAMSDRALPRSYAMMEGFGVHTFRLINEAGVSHFVKFHWKPTLGVHSLVWDETQKLAGKDPDFNRRDLWEAIEKEAFPEYELGLQIIPESDEFAFDFDILDATKIWPEELVPVQPVGKMILNRNPDNYFQETEQVAFHPGHLVPGIDFSNDPLLQGRLFSYLDTQLIRLGGPNFAEIPINRPQVPVVNNQQDGYMRQNNMKRKVNYSPNSLGGGCPYAAGADMGAFTHYAERIDGHKIKQRSESFNDHFTQARLFYNSVSKAEQMHILEAFQFELGKVDTMHIRERMVDLIAKVDTELAQQVAEGVGVTKKITVEPQPMPTTEGKRRVDVSPALSQLNTAMDSIKSRKVAILIEDGFDGKALDEIKGMLEKAGATCEVISKAQGQRKAATGADVQTDKSHVTTGSIMYDAVLIPGGRQSVDSMKKMGKVLHFIREAYKHCKPIAAIGEGVELVEACQLPEQMVFEQAQTDKGLVSSAKGGDAAEVGRQFIEAIKKHRHWEREENKELIPA